MYLMQLRGLLLIDCMCVAPLQYIEGSLICFELNANYVL